MFKLLRVLLLIVLICNYKAVGQNLISNYSFEQFLSNAWYPILTVDYLNAGPGQEGNVSVTHGTTCVGLRFWSPVEDNWQEYIAQSIAGDFEAGKTYKVSFNYKLASRSVFSTDDLGVGFLHNWVGNPSGIEAQIGNINPALKNPENAILTNYNQYKKFSQYYTSTGTETWLLIGCFKKDYNLTYVPISNPTSNPMTDIYFLIDEVEVYACPPMPKSLLDKSLIVCDELPFELSTSISADSYLWSNGSSSSSTQISPDENVIWLEATFGQCKMRDTVSIQRFSGPSDLGQDVLLCGSTDFPVELKVNALPNETVIWNTGHVGSNLIVNSPGDYSVIKSLGSCEWMDQLSVVDLLDEIVLYPNPTSNQIHFKDENNISILSISSEEGKKLIAAPISIVELNLLINELKPAIYILDVELKSCKKRLKLSLINN
jgi:hypothetical protein